MDVYGTDGGNSSNLCLNIVDLDHNIITLTGIASDGKWYNAIWMDLTDDQMINALVMALENDAFFRQGLGKNKKYAIGLVLDEDTTIVIDSTEKAQEVLSALLN